MTRNNDNDAIFKSDNVDGGGNDVVADGKITLNKISWIMTHVTPADKDKMELYILLREKKNYRLDTE